MTWVDIVILVIIVGLILHGMIIGLIRGAFDIAGIIIGYILAIQFNDTIRIPRFLAFLLIFIVVVIAISVLGRFISKALHATPLGVFDRLFGGVLGLIKGFIISFVFILIVLLVNRTSKTVHESQIAPLVIKGGVTMSYVLPKRWFEKIKGIVTRKELVMPGAVHGFLRDHHISV